MFLKQVKPEHVDLNFFENSVSYQPFVSLIYLTMYQLSLSVKLPNGSNYSLELDPLAHNVIPKECTYKILSTKIEIKLKKAMAGIMWGALESENDQGTASMYHRFFFYNTVDLTKNVPE